MFRLSKKNYILMGVLAPLIIGVGLTARPEADPALKWRVEPLVYKQSAIESSLLVQNEPLFGSQYHLNHLNISDVWDSNRGEGVTVAIIDSGVNPNHEDFYDGVFSNISPASAYVQETGYSTSNVKIQTVADKGINIIADPIDNGHGTNVAGTIGALVNGIGTAGVSPEVTLLVLKTNYLFTEIKAAIRYAADNGADIINMSIGVYEETFTDSYGDVNVGVRGASTYFQSTIDYAYNKGVTIIAAAGNENSYNSSYPASNNHVIGVGALAKNSSSSIASYSNHGLNNVDIVAPGSVYVADVGGTSAYTITQGTSFSSPIVASAAALYKSKNPSATPFTIEEKLKQSAFDLGAAGKDPIFGYGRLDMSRLMADVPVTVVEILPKTMTLRTGETGQLTANVLPFDASNKEHIFISNDESIATVDETTGVVTAIAVGETEIGVLTEDGMYEDYSNITVIDPSTPIAVSSISFSEPFLTLGLNKTQTLNVNFLPSNATNKNLTYSSSDSTIVTVTSQGVVTGQKAGNATITATSVDGGKIATINVTVNNTVTTNFTYTFISKDWGAIPNNWVSGASGNGYLNNGIQVTTGSSGANAKSPDYFSNINSIKVGYATNASNGVGKIQLFLLETPSSSGTKLGEYNVTTSGGTTKRDTTPFVPSTIKNGYIKIVVTTTTNSIYICDIDINYDETVATPVSVSGVTFTSGPLNLITGNTAVLNYEVLPENASNKGVQFSSLNNNIVTVNNSGTVTAIGAGTTQIIITTIDGGFTDLIDVTVSDPITYEPELILETTNFKTNYKFKEQLDLKNLTARYINSHGNTTHLTANDLDLISGSTSVIGKVTLVFSYQELNQTIQINVTNIGATQNGGEPISQSLTLHVTEFSPSITTTSSSYSQIEAGGMNFNAKSIRKRIDGSSNILMIDAGGHLYNTSSLGPIQSISLTYTLGGSAGAVQSFSYSTQPITSKPTTFNQIVSDSSGGSTTTVNINNNEYFRLDVSNKILQALITINYVSGNSVLFTAQEQADAYASYFMNVTHNECELSNVKSSTWDELKNEYAAMSDEAKAIIKTSNYSALHARYNIIVSSYHYEDFIAAARSPGVNLFDNFSANKQSLLSFSVLFGLLFAGSCGYYIFFRKKYNM